MDIVYVVDGAESLCLVIVLIYCMLVLIVIEIILLKVVLIKHVVHHALVLELYGLNHSTELLFCLIYCR